MNTEVQRAREFAIRVHAEQRYGSHPYSYHLDAVADLLNPFGDLAQVAAYLHDTVEDCDVSLADIESNFGKEMAQCIAVLTDEPGENRKARKAKTNEKLRLTKNTLALTVKAADRLANLLESQQDPSGSKLSMYRREHEAFKNAAFRPGLCDELWNRIDSIIDTPQH